MSNQTLLQRGTRVRLIAGMFRGTVCTIDDICMRKGYPIYSLKNRTYTCPLHYTQGYMEPVTDGCDRG